MSVREANRRSQKLLPFVSTEKHAPQDSIKAALMPSSHLLRAPHDKWIYDFPYDISGIVGGNGLRPIHSYCVPASYNFLYGHLVTGRAKPYGGYAEIRWKLCVASAIAVQSL